MGELEVRDAGDGVDPTDLIWIQDVTKPKEQGGPYGVPTSTLYTILQEHPEVGPFKMPGHGNRSYLLKSLLEPLLRPQHRPLRGTYSPPPMG